MGFDTERFITGISDEKRCSLCRGVLDNPVRTPCFHVFCSGCIFPWVVRHGSCPRHCRPLNPADLENVLSLRHVILNMKVKCDFIEEGCTEVLRLTDLVMHTQECCYRPVVCSNPGCGLTVNFHNLKSHESFECEFRPVGVCQKGCGLAIVANTAEKHDCIDSLKQCVSQEQEKVAGLEQEMRRLVSKLSKREKSLLGQVAALHRQVQLQSSTYQRKLAVYKCQLITFTGLTETQASDDEQTGLTVTLQRDKTGSLGFNIMGGFTHEPNNNTKVSYGIIVSRVTDSGSADKNGMKTQDKIIKVNGHDLSQSTHEEAVEAFRTAKEPIVVEVLRRVNKNKLKSRSPTMVSIGTQTEEDFYCYNRPPTPPPGFYPLHVTGLYQPSSRRPVAFSPSAEMGLTDIEMAHNADLDDPYFDDRQYEMEYEEVNLHRSSSDAKLGLTLCYGSLEDEVTDIFISEIDSNSIAARDGRIREGDQILQINGVDVHNRHQAIKLFSANSTDTTLLVTRPQLQCDDGFMDEQNMMLDDLHMDLLEKHHHDNMQFMASMLARRHLDEEGGTTDTATTENSSNKHEKDSGVGRTDESTKNDESSEQENFDSESITPPTTNLKARPNCNLNRGGHHHHSNESFNEHEVIGNEISPEACDKFREVLQHRCVDNSPRKDSCRKDSESSLERELAMLNQEMEDIQLECQNIVEAHLKIDPNKDAVKLDQQRSPRIVPRMGTRLEYLKHVQSLDPSEFWSRRGLPNMNSTKMGQQQQPSKTSEKEKDTSTTSAYNTGESCRSTPLTLELNQTSDEGDKGFKNSLLCLAPAPNNVPSSSDTEKQTQTPTKTRDYSSDDSGHGYKAIVPVSQRVEQDGVKVNVLEKVSMGESLQDLYMEYADVMYTNHANLEHTMAVQQKLFQQQLDQKSRLKSHSTNSGGQNSNSGDNKQVSGKDLTPSDSGALEWVVKRRPDGTRYITRRPVRNKMLKERAKKISEERCGMTTDDDAMSEMKTGRYWSKDDRKRHLEKAKDYKKKKELMLKARMETLKESEEKKETNIVELSHRKMNKHKGKKVFDNFVTVQEMLAHGSRIPDGKTYNPLLSVTTV